MVFLGTDKRSTIDEIIPYLEKHNIKYTTNIFDSFEYVLLTDINIKTDKLIKNLKDKHFIFLTHFEEEKIYNRIYSPLKNHIKYRSLMYKILYECDIYTSNFYIKELLKKKIKSEINVIGLPLFKKLIPTPRKELVKKYNINKNKLILCFDPYYQNMDIIISLLEKYPKCQFCYIGYSLNINKNDLKKLDLIRKNSTIINDLSVRNIYSLLLIGDIAINMCTNYDALKLSDLILYSATPSFIINNSFYINSLVNSKNTYLYKDSNDLIKKLNKYFNGRIANLSKEGYDYIIENSIDTFLTKLNKYK